MPESNGDPTTSQRKHNKFPATYKPIALRFRTNNVTQKVYSQAGIIIPMHLEY